MSPMLFANLHGLFALQYLDPGAGSIVVQVIVAGIVGIAAVMKFYWRRITSLLGGSARKSSVER